MLNRFTIVMGGTIMLVVLATAFLGRSSLYPSSVPHAPQDTVIFRAGQPSANPITLYYHERRPYYVTTPNQVHGRIADRLNWVFKEAGIPYEWHKTPAKRQLEMIRDNEQPACAAGWYKTPEREAFGNFTLPIYMDSPTIALARADNDQIQSDAPLAKTLSNRILKLLRKDGYSYGTHIDAALKRFAPREVVTTAENLSMIKMIHTHRADYFFITREEAEDLILSSGLPGDDFKAISFTDMPPGNKRYLICSRRIDTVTRLRLNSAIKEYLLGSMAANPMDKGFIQ